MIMNSKINLNFYLILKELSLWKFKSLTRQCLWFFLINFQESPYLIYKNFSLTPILIKEMKPLFGLNTVLSFLKILTLKILIDVLLLLLSFVAVRVKFKRQKTFIKKLLICQKIQILIIKYYVFNFMETFSKKSKEGKKKEKILLLKHTLWLKNYLIGVINQFMFVSLKWKFEKKINK